jgi:putative two-component system response regulator
MNSIEAQDAISSNLRFRIAELEVNHRKHVLAMACSLISLVDLRDCYTAGHSNRVAGMCRGICVTLGLGYDDTDRIVTAGLLHDIGKIGVPDHVLLKPGRLTDEEFEIIRKHPELGWISLRDIPDFDDIGMLLLHHHERIDGKGYPGGLRGNEIPMGSRIIAVADTFDALTSDRPYRRACPREEAFDEMHRCSGTQLDPDALHAFKVWINPGILHPAGWHGRARPRTSQHPTV